MIKKQFFNIINVSTVFCDKGFMTLQNKSINFLIKNKKILLTPKPLNSSITEYIF